MFSSFMTNTWIVATIIAVLAGVVGFFVVLRGSAFPAHAIPNSAFAGAAAANIFGFSALLGLAGAAGLAAFGIATLGRRGRHDVVTAFVLVLGLAIGAIFLTRSEEYEPQLYSLLFGEVLGVSTTELLARGAPGHCLHRRHRIPVPPPALVVHRARGRRVQGYFELPNRTGLPARPRRSHGADRAGRGRATDLLADDRSPRRRPLIHCPTSACHSPVGGHRAHHCVGGDRQFL